MVDYSEDYIKGFVDALEMVVRKFRSVRIIDKDIMKKRILKR